MVISATKVRLGCIQICVSFELIDVDAFADDLAAALGSCGPDAPRTYTDRDRTIAIALLAGLERTPWTDLGIARHHVRWLFRFAGIRRDDDRSTVKAKMERYFARNSMHPLLARRIGRVLRDAIDGLVDLAHPKKMSAA